MNGDGIVEAATIQTNSVHGHTQVHFSIVAAVPELVHLLKWCHELETMFINNYLSNHQHQNLSFCQKNQIQLCYYSRRACYNIFGCMFTFLSSFGASSNFEKYRLEITAKTFDAPSQQTLRAIVDTFSGQDPETKSQIAFATIVKKLLTSDSRTNWLYLIKNLIILDRIVDEGCFAEQVRDLTVATLDNFRQSDIRNLQVFDSQRMIGTFWRLVKEKSKVLATGKHIFCYKRSQRTQFLTKLTHTELLAQIQSIEGFFALTFELVEYLSGKKLSLERPEAAERTERARAEWSGSRLLEYLYLQVLHKLMLYYSCQLLLNQAFLMRLSRDSSLTEEDIRTFKRHVFKFRLNANEYVRYVEARKQIKGFEELNYKELNPFRGEDITKLLDELIVQKQKEAEGDRPLLHPLPVDEQMRVEKKPFANLKNDDVLIPRLRHRPIPQEDPTCFLNWSSAYSNVFPQSEVLSVDLLVEMRQGKENDVEQVPVEDANRESVIFGNRDTNVSSAYQIICKMEKSNPKPLPFKNQFSELPSKWNS